MTTENTLSETLWDDFLTRWPLEKLTELTLPAYSTAGSTDTFTYWLESLTEDLGSIWGGSAFKFGVFSRKDQTDKVDSNKLSYNSEHGWYTQYGHSPSQVFDKVKALIIEIANAARAGDLPRIEAVVFSPSVKWKIAFLYQDRSSPKIVAVFDLKYLRAAVGEGGKSLSQAQANERLMALRGDVPVLDYSAAVWARAEGILKDRQMAELVGHFKLIEGFEDCWATCSEAQRGLFYRLAHVLHDKGFDWYDLDLVNEFRAGCKKDKGNKAKSVVARVFMKKAGFVVKLDNLPSKLDELCAAPREIDEALLVAVKRAKIEDWKVQPAQSKGGLWPDNYIGIESVSEDDFMSEANERLSQSPLNQILFGPPGTGKTYATIDEALRIIDPEFLAKNVANRAELKKRFDVLAGEGHIKFTTFHQSFSYEDFVEGLSASTEDNQIQYEVKDGVFKILCDAAITKVTRDESVSFDLTGRKVWKMSLGNTLGADAFVFDDCISNGYALLGYGDDVDFSGCENQSDILKRYQEKYPATKSGEYAVSSVNVFKNKIRIGDIIVVTDGNFKFRAIGEVTSDYRFITAFDDMSYRQCRNIKWLRTYTPSKPWQDLMNNAFSQMTLYQLHNGSIDRDKLNYLLNDKSHLREGEISVGQSFASGYEVVSVNASEVVLKKPRGGSIPISMSVVRVLLQMVQSGQITVDDINNKKVFEKCPDVDLEKYLINGYANVFAFLVNQLLIPASERALTNAKVLIIDEINRGNVSRIFGELITLIEPSKRAGAEEALSVVLPYSKTPFSVPDNVYLIGTMNTADRSLMGLDIALRRRFTFKEMPPIPELLDEVVVESVRIGDLLRVMNQRIEVLLDRDHCLGHAYFMPLREDASLDKLAFIFKSQIVPLLQEYFFEDWQRIQWELNVKSRAEFVQFINKPKNDLKSLFGDEVAKKLDDSRWALNEDAFNLIENYRQILGTHA